MAGEGMNVDGPLSLVIGFVLGTAAFLACAFWYERRR